MASAEDVDDFHAAVVAFTSLPERSSPARGAEFRSPQTAQQPSCRYLMALSRCFLRAMTRRLLLADTRVHMQVTVSGKVAHYHSRKLAIAADVFV